LWWKAGIGSSRGLIDLKSTEVCCKGPGCRPQHWSHSSWSCGLESCAFELFLMIMPGGSVLNDDTTTAKSLGKMPVNTSMALVRLQNVLTMKPIARRDFTITWLPIHTRLSPMHFSDNWHAKYARAICAVDTLQFAPIERQASHDEWERESRMTINRDEQLQ
jgi:hypothetical protein